MAHRRQDRQQRSPGTANTIAILWPPNRQPIIATVYYTESAAPMDARNAIHKDIGALIAETF